MALGDRKLSGDDTVHYIPARKRRPQAKVKLQPPLTPMIDVTFQLLIFFLLTMTFREQEGQIPGALPRLGGLVAGQQVKLEPLTIVIRPVGSDRSRCTYQISGRTIPMETAEQLYQVLKARQQEIGADEPVVIKPRPNVRWQFVVEAFNQAVRAHYKDIGYATTDYSLNDMGRKVGVTGPAGSSGGGAAGGGSAGSGSAGSGSAGSGSAGGGSAGGGSAGSGSAGSGSAGGGSAGSGSV